MSLYSVFVLPYKIIFFSCISTTAESAASYFTGASSVSFDSFSEKVSVLCRFKESADKPNESFESRLVSDEMILIRSVLSFFGDIVSFFGGMVSFGDKVLVKSLLGVRCAAVVNVNVQSIATISSVPKKYFELNLCSCFIRLWQK